jgi:ribosomal-protein-alanine N-acetyltransferase
MSSLIRFISTCSHVTEELSETNFRRIVGGQKQKIRSQLDSPSHFTTDHLILRPPVVADAQDIFSEYCQDSAVTRYLMWQPHKSIQDTQSFLSHCVEQWKNSQEFTWVICLQTYQRAIGMISARRFSHTVEIGYALSQQHWRTGIMSEAARTIMEWWLSQPTIYRVQALCDADNVASAKLLQKIGMINEGLLHRWAIHPNISTEPRDCFMYARTK